MVFKTAFLRSPIKLYNSLTKSLNELPVKKPSITWYSCGPTVYDDMHVGHASALVRLDIIIRCVEKWHGIPVTFAMGVTDIDDKIISRSISKKVHPLELASYYEKRWFEDSQRLQVRKPDLVRRVSLSINSIIFYISKLIDNGHAYSTKFGNVYFSVHSLPSYGRLIKTPAHQTQTNIELTDKNSPEDFALWKKTENEAIGYSSPWGIGRPGWHIECSTFCLDLFGKKLDVHSGGIDLAFPHHTNELAQCDALLKSSWCQHFVHTGLLRLSESSMKMSKSQGEIVSCSEMLDNWSHEVFRMMCLESRYRGDIVYSTERLEQSKLRLERYQRFLKSVDNFVKQPNDEKEDIHVDVNNHLDDTIMESITNADTSISNAINDDINTPLALSIVDQLISDLRPILLSEVRNRYLFPVSAAGMLVESTLKHFGLFQNHSFQSSSRFHSAIDVLMKLRSNIRNFALENPKLDSNIKLLAFTDEARNDLYSHGIHVNDVKGSDSSWT